MVQLVDSDIKTREVLGWKGVHVLHFMGSSCSQKLRIFLNLKGIKWESHLVDLFTNENFRPWFLGINPRGLVPVLVHDGAVQSRATTSSSISNGNFRHRGSSPPAMRTRSRRCSSTKTTCTSTCAR
jgi:hypothetical protein